MIEAKLIDHMGSDLSVVNAARVSYGKRSDWERRVNRYDETNDITQWEADGWEYESESTSGDVYRRLSDKDSNLIKFLARGMSSKEFDSFQDDLDLASCDGDWDQFERLIKDFRNVPLHKSPFNHAFATFHCKAPIYVARQLVKHEYMPWNEISGRYVEFEADFFIPDQFRQKADDKKQGSGDPLPPEGQAECRSILEAAHKVAYDSYKAMIDAGVCEEQARGVLPLNLMTEWYWSGSLGAIAKMAQHRIRTDAQEETRIIANQIDEQMKELFPVSWAALVHGEY